MSINKVAVIYDDRSRPETTGVYCRRALGQLVEVEHFLPTELSRIPRSFDLYLNIDDGLRYRLPADLHPSAWWAIDTHLDLPWYLEKGSDFDFIFTAQKDGAERLAEAGLPVRWLPLACDPEIHSRHDLPKVHDICFVGNIMPGPRADLLCQLQQRFPNIYIGRCYFDEMAKAYSSARLVFNRSVNGDVNMRVFEALACGSLLLTDDLKGNGLAEMFQNGVHMATYSTADELFEKVDWYLHHDAEREAIATAGRRAVLNGHTYLDRMRTILSAVALRTTKGSGGPSYVTRKERYYYEFARPEVLALVPTDARTIVELGCGTGRLGASIKARQPAHVVGIEIDAEAATAAADRLDKVIVADVEMSRVDLPDQSCDCVIAADVLEHLRNPEAVLKRVRRWLRPQGTLVLSLPNVQHHTVVRGLLSGDWTYESAGLLDNTHLRFFTKQSIDELCRNAGFVIQAVEGVPGPGDAQLATALKSSQMQLGHLQLKGLDDTNLEGFFVYQYLVKASPDGSNIQPPESIVTPHDMGHRAPSVESHRRAEISRQAPRGDDRAKERAFRRRMLRGAPQRTELASGFAGSAKSHYGSASIGVVSGELERRIPDAANQVLTVWCGTEANCSKVPFRIVANGKSFVAVDDSTLISKPSEEWFAGRDTCDVNETDPDSPKSTFDCVLCDGLDRVPDLDCFLRRVHELLGESGMLIASFGNVQHHRVLSALLTGDWVGAEDDPDRIRFLTCREAEKLLYRHWFDVFSMQGTKDERTEINSEIPESNFSNFLLSNAHLAATQQLQSARLVVEARRVSRAKYGLTSIIILTHNEFPYTRECLDSIRLRTDEPYELILVDNGSIDGTLEYLQSLDDIRLLHNSTNRGFPAAVNQGIDIATGQNILLLNNDCVVTTGWLRRLLSVLHGSSRIGLVGPYSNNTSGYQQIPVTYHDLTGLDGFAWEWARDRQGQSKDVDRLIGFCLLMKRELVERIGVLDERFGIGCYEDDDYCRRARSAGFKTVIAEDAFVHHYGSRTFVGSGANLDAIMRVNEQKYHDKWRGQSISSSNSHNPQSIAPNASGFLVEIVPAGGLRLVRRRARLSLCMIVRDNEATIRPCLESIRPYVDELVVVDTGSKDGTPEICRELGARVYHFEWCDDFSAARNESLKYACGEWLFWMDSDDTIPAECGRQLRLLADGPHDDNILGYVMQVHCPGGDPHDITVVDHIKMFRNRPDLRFQFRLHEQILPAIRLAGGDVEFTGIHVIHSGADCSPRTRERKLLRDLRILRCELLRYPDHPFVLFNLGMTYSDVEQHADAIVCLRKCISVSRPEESHLRKAYAMLVNSLSRSRRQSEAWEACLAGMSLYPHDKELLFRKAMLLHEAGQLQEAVETYQQILAEPSELHFASRDIGTHSYKARHNLALICEEIGDQLQADREWAAILEEVPDYQPARAALANSEATRRTLKSGSKAGLLPATVMRT